MSSPADAFNSDLTERLVEAFLPFQPVQSAEDFAARHDLLREVTQAIAEHRNHIVIYGPSGCGKTSTARVLADLAQRAQFISFYVSGTRFSTLRDLFAPILAQLPLRLDAVVERSTTPGSFADLLPQEEKVSPPQLADILSRISGVRLLICIDEVELIENRDTERDILELMKLLSDRSAPVYIVGVGVASSAEELFGDVASLPRAVFEVAIGGMSPREMSELVMQASRSAGMEMAPETAVEIARLAHGKPFVGKLLGLAAAKCAALNNASSITTVDLDNGLSELMTRYRRAGSNRWLELVERNPRLMVILRAATLAPRDSSGAFSARSLLSSPLGPTEADIRAELGTLVGGHGMLLEDVSEGRRERFRFQSVQSELCATILCARPSTSLAAP